MSGAAPNRARALTALVALGFCALLGAASAEAAFPGRPGVIAFDSQGAIRTISARGGGSTRLADGLDPAFSPNGRMIAFVKGRNLIVMKSDGSDPRTVYSAHSISSPCFSADGKKLFFTRDTSGEGYADIYSVRLEGGSARRLTHTGSAGSEIDSNSPQAAANGRYLVFQRSEHDVWTMRPDGSHQKLLAHGAAPSISPDSRQVVFARGERLVLIGAAGGHERVLKPIQTKKQSNELIRAAAWPTFSPDSRQIAFTMKRTTSTGPGLNDSLRLAVYSLASRKLEILTKPSLGGRHADWQALP